MCAENCNCETKCADCKCESTVQSAQVKEVIIISKDTAIDVVATLQEWDVNEESGFYGGVLFYHDNSSTADESVDSLREQGFEIFDLRKISSLVHYKK